MVKQPQSEYVFEEILARIRDGRLEMNAIINEVELAEEFGVSRGPVREAVRRLHGFGLITQEAHKRSRVISLTDEDVRDAVQLREALECLAVRLAIERISDDELEALTLKLEDHHERTSGQVKARKDGQPESYDFHDSIITRSGNRQIMRVLQHDLFYILQIYRRRSAVIPGRRERAYQQHWQILRAMQNRDAMLAESLMREHIREGSELLLGTLSRSSGYEQLVATGKGKQ
jgi:DNA-binding GntR family transcriptional regulator